MKPSLIRHMRSRKTRKDNMSSYSPPPPSKRKNNEKKKNESKVADASIRIDWYGNHLSSQLVLERGTGNFEERGALFFFEEGFEFNLPDCIRPFLLACFHVLLRPLPKKIQNFLAVRFDLT